jgi:OmcA/MtrC family decaheme c-type cytochrome
MTVTAENCFSCHESIEGFGDAFEDSGTLFHEDFDESTDCTVCHNDVDGIAEGVITAFHNGLETEREGIIWNGVDTSVTEGAKFTWTISDVVDNGTTLAISWQATYGGAPVDPCGATAPVFHGDGAGNLSVLYSYAQGEDFILGTSNAPGQASSVNVTTTNTTCAAGVATTTITPARVAGATKARIAIQGKPRVTSVANATELMSVRAKTPTYDFVVGTGDPAAPRREIVDTAGKCLKCHVGSLYQHGGNRVDNVDMCVICHNSASNEQNVRVGFGVDASEAYDGKVGQTYEFKSMLHAIHSAGEDGAAPIVIYRTRGIYAWATSRDLLPNWPGEGSQIVYGSNDVTQPHNFHTPTYPRPMNDCGACHADGFESIIPDQAKAMATTLEAGVDPWTNQVDDVLQGAGAAACTSCHSDSAAKGHAYQNGWTPQAFPNGRQTIIDATK